MISFLRWKNTMNSQSAAVIADVLVEVLIIASYIRIYTTAISKSAEKMMMHMKLAIT